MAYNLNKTIKLKHLKSAVERMKEEIYSDINSWNDVKKAVRAGLGKKFFPVGYEFTTHNSDENTDIIWAVRGNDHHVAADESLNHTMTLEMKYVYSSSSGACINVSFDENEALYYAENGLAAGTYHFSVANHMDSVDNGKTYQLTLTKAVPAGGQIVLFMSSYADTKLVGKSVKTYASPYSTAAIETATITEGNGGTSLGTTDGTGGMNHLHRAFLGSNNYAQSAIDQWLNSSAAKGLVWTPQTVFDRPPFWANTYNGFMHGLPEDFLAVVQPAIIPCRTNSIYEINSLDGTEFTVNQNYELTRKFFLLSRPEIFGAGNPDGKVLEYYNGLTKDERIHYDAGSTARTTMLRSPYVSYAYYHYCINISGSSAINESTIFNNGIAAACIIA